MSLWICSLAWNQVIWKQFDLDGSCFCGLLGRLATVFCLWVMILYDSRKTLRGIPVGALWSFSLCCLAVAAKPCLQLYVECQAAIPWALSDEYFQSQCSPCLHQLSAPACCSGQLSELWTLTWGFWLSWSGSLTSGSADLCFFWIATNFILFIACLSETIGLCCLMFNILETVVLCILMASLMFSVGE